MTDNEKRAHDLAVAVSVNSCNMSMNAQISNGKTEISIDYFASYMDAYKVLLDAFNEKFPDGK